MARPNPAKRVGRYVDPHTRGRVTKRRDPGTIRSPHWYGWMILDLLAYGVLVILLNYLQVLPGAASPWYLVVGLISMFSGFYLATRYR